LSYKRGGVNSNRLVLVNFKRDERYDLPRFFVGGKQENERIQQRRNRTLIERERTIGRRTIDFRTSRIGQ